MNLFENLQKLNEVRKEDDLYYQGAFWIIGDTFIDILKGNFKIEGVKLLSNYDGEYVNLNKSKNSLRHTSLWNNEFKNKVNPNVEFDYYPRGRVSIYQGIAFIHLNSKCNTPKIIDEIVNKYELNKLKIEIEYNDNIQGSHYDFKLK